MAILTRLFSPGMVKRNRGAWLPELAACTQALDRRKQNLVLQGTSSTSALWLPTTPMQEVSPSCGTVYAVQQQAKPSSCRQHLLWYDSSTLERNQATSADRVRQAQSTS